MTSDTAKGHSDCFWPMKIKKSIDDSGQTLLHLLTELWIVNNSKSDKLHVALSLFYYRATSFNANVRCEVMLWIQYRNLRKPKQIKTNQITNKMLLPGQNDVR